MRIACAIDSMVEHPPGDVLDVIRSAGFGAISLGTSSHVQPPGAPLPDVDSPEADLYHELASRDLQVAAVAVPPATAEISEYMRAAEAALSTASRHKAETLVLQNLAAPDASNWSEWLVAVQQLGHRAKKLGMNVSLDFRDAVDSDSRSMLEVVQQIDCRSIGLCFDTGRYLHDNPTSNGEIALQRVCGHVSFLRLSDHSGCADDEDFPALGDAGGVDFARTWEIVRNFGFSGPSAVLIRPRRAARASLDQWRGWLEQCLKHLERCGWPFRS